MCTSSCPFCTNLWHHMAAYQVAHLRWGKVNSYTTVPRTRSGEMRGGRGRRHRSDLLMYATVVLHSAVTDLILRYAPLCCVVLASARTTSPLHLPLNGLRCYASLRNQSPADHFPFSESPAPDYPSSSLLLSSWASRIIRFCLRPSACAAAL